MRNMFVRFFLFLHDNDYMDLPEFMSTRLDKKSSYTAEDLTGLSKKCDVFIFKTEVIRLNSNDKPYYYFISTYSSIGLFHFTNKILPELTYPIVLILASEDITFPTGQKDVRYDCFGYKSNQPLIFSMINNPMIKRIFVENLDTLHPKLTPIPLGMHPVTNTPYINLYKQVQTKLIFYNFRSDKILCVHRLHDDGTSQWDDRKRVGKYCLDNWKSYVQYFPNLYEDQFRNKLLEFKFVICVHGGGLDLSPKIWQALLCGCMPIIESSTLDEVYSRFPVIFVDKWDSDTVTAEKLCEWNKLYDDNETWRIHLKILMLDYRWDGDKTCSEKLDELNNLYDKFNKNIENRKSILKMLTLDYWWDEISKA